jgi:hypothetical protein
VDPGNNPLFVGCSFALLFSLISTHFPHKFIKRTASYGISTFPFKLRLNVLSIRSWKELGLNLFLRQMIESSVLLVLCTKIHKTEVKFKQSLYRPGQGSRRLRLPECLHNRHMKMAMLSALCARRLYPPGHKPGTHFC